MSCSQIGLWRYHSHLHAHLSTWPVVVRSIPGAIVTFFPKMKKTFLRLLLKNECFSKMFVFIDTFIEIFYVSIVCNEWICDLYVIKMEVQCYYKNIYFHSFFSLWISTRKCCHSKSYSWILTLYLHVFSLMFLIDKISHFLCTKGKHGIACE